MQRGKPSTKAKLKRFRRVEYQTETLLGVAAFLGEGVELAVIGEHAAFALTVLFQHEGGDVDVAIQRLIRRQPGPPLDPFLLLGHHPASLGAARSRSRRPTPA